MPRFILRTNNAIEKNVEKGFMNMIRSELNFICSNNIRACILHLLVKAKELNHSMQVEEIAHRLGKRHSVIIYHLEQLEKWRLVEVVKNFKYGGKQRRSIWGLNLRYPNLISEVYNHILKFFFTKDELNELCSVNRNPRANLKRVK